MLTFGSLHLALMETIGWFTVVPGVQEVLALLAAVRGWVVVCFMLGLGHGPKEPDREGQGLKGWTV